MAIQIPDGWRPDDLAGMGGSWRCACGMTVSGARPTSGKCATCDPEAYDLPVPGTIEHLEAWEKRDCEWLMHRDGRALVAWMREPRVPPLATEPTTEAEVAESREKLASITEELREFERANGYEQVIRPEPAMGTSDNPWKCDACGEDADERCGGDHCRRCHVSLTFEECVDGSWSEKIRAKAGLPERKVIDAALSDAVIGQRITNDDGTMRPYAEVLAEARGRGHDVVAAIKSMRCGDCRGSGKYVGAVYERDDCKACGGSGWA